MYHMCKTFFEEGGCSLGCDQHYCILLLDNSKSADNLYLEQILNKDSLLQFTIFCCMSVELLKQSEGRRAPTSE